MAVTRILPPPVNVDANDYSYKRWFQDIYKYSEGGVLIPTAELVPNYGGRRNLVQNGDFSIWQRGTSFTIGAVASTPTADRWVQSRGSIAGSTAARYTISSSDLPLPQEFKYALNATRTIGDTSSADVTIAHHIESETAARVRGKTCVLSFWLKGGTGLKSSIPTFRTLISSGTGTNENRISGYTGNRTSLNAAFNAPTTWTYYQFPVTFNVDTNEIAILFSYRNPSNNPAVANENFLITGVQLEIARDQNYPKATSFDYVPFGTQLQECARYYQKSFKYQTAPAQNTASLDGLFEFPCTIAGATAQQSPSNSFVPRMLKTPTMTFYNSNASNAFVLNLTRVTSATATAGTTGVGERGFAVSCTGVAGWVVGDRLAVHYQADAEI